MDIGKNQIELIDYAKKYISMINGTGVNISKSAYCWLVPVPGAPGYFILKRLYNKGKLTLKSIYFFFKYFIGIAILHDYKIINRISNLEKNYNRLIISFAWKNNFNNDGSYTDNYLNLNSKQDLKNLWFLIYLEDDGKIPNKIDKNILIFGKENLKRKYCFFYLLKVFFNIIKNSKSSLTKIFHESSRPSHYSEIVIKEVTNLIKSLNFKSILMSYENQPFQNGIFESVKKINNNIKLIGYLHSTQPLPVLHICRSGSPDLLLVHGDDQIFHLKKYLNWHDSKLKLIPALRYNKNNIKKFGNNLVLPINLSNEKILLNQFDFFLKNKNNKSLKSFTIRNHPFRKNSKSHKIFIKNLENILSRYSDKFSNNIQNEISVFFGGTSSVLEALESGFKVNRICADPVFESYSEAIWPSIRVRAINDFLFEYELSHKGKCINLGSGDNIFEKYPEL